MNLLQGEHDAGQRRVKSRSQSCAGSAGQQIFFFCFSPVHGPGDCLARHGAQLNGGAFPAQREPAQQTEKTSREFGRENLPPGLVQFTRHFPFQLRNTGTGDQRLPAKQPAHHKSQKHQGQKPQGEHPGLPVAGVDYAV